MGEKTGISWTDHTFNIAWGCTKVSPGCAHCYAERDAKRYGHDVWGSGTERRTFGERHWAEPLKWNRNAIGAEKVFCSSMCDIYEDHSTIDHERDKLWDLIRQTPNLIWQLLTKRPERIKGTTPADILNQRNVWFGTSAEDQKYWDLRVPVLVACGAQIMFVSAEPLLEGITPGTELMMLDWLIIGGESGSNRRPCHLDDITELAWDADQLNVAVWIKQDSALKPGQQGRIPSDVWKMKAFPK